MDDRRLAFLQELERADEEVAATLAELDELYSVCEATRVRALELEAALERLPAEREAARLHTQEADRGVEAAREVAAAAAVELSNAEVGGDAERLAAARRLDVRARDTLAVAERRSREAEERVAELETRAEAAAREAQALEQRAAELAAALRERPRLAAEAGEPPGPGLAGVAEWGTRARAALLVARSQLAAERDAVVRQANELGTLILGEPLTATSAASVARRVEREGG